MNCLKYRDYETVNDIILELGVQSGSQHLSNGFYYLEKSQGWEKVFHPSLEKHREWMEGLNTDQVEQIYWYALTASSLAYRYLRKRNKARKK